MPVKTSDAVVVGGGVVGASAAFHLARLGVGRVTLCERSTLGAGATGKSAALVRTHYHNEAEARLAFASLPYFQRWDELVGAGSCGFVRTGYLHLEPPENRAGLKEDVEMLRRIGVNTALLSTDEIGELAPYLQVDDAPVGAFEPDSGYAYSVATAEGFAEAAQRSGAEILQGVAVMGIDLDGRRVTGVTTLSGSIASPLVIVAAGIWSASLLREAGLELPLQAARTQVGVFEWPPARDGQQLTTVNDPINRLYFRPDGVEGDRIIGGLGSGSRRDLPDPDHINEDVDPDYLLETRTRLRLRVPWAEYARALGGWAGPITLTPDGMPIIDRHPTLDGCFYFTGDCGSSFKTAPAIGRGLADWAILGSPLKDDFHPFRSDRFASVARGDTLAARDFVRLSGTSS